MREKKYLPTDHRLLHRRSFLRQGLVLGSLLPLTGSKTLAALPAPAPLRKPAPLKILVLGGTGFLGPQQIAYALDRGHSITMFNRGITKPTTEKDVFARVEQLTGDRENDLESLKNRNWDAVIDNSGNRVKWVHDTAQLLKEKTDLYLYTSSTGVYYPYLGKNIKENSKLVMEVPPGLKEPQLSEYNYGVMKAHAEKEVWEAFGENRSIIVRPTYMMGPGDRTDRFSYWPIRLSKGGDVFVPGKPKDPVQYIDVRDVAGWMIRLIEDHKAGVYNAVGPASPTGMHPFVYGVHAAFSSPVNFVMVPDYTFLKKQNIYDAIPWIMPIDENAGSALINIDQALANGLTFTPLADSARDIHDWWYSDDVSAERRDRLEKNKDSLLMRESAILDAWKKMRK